MEANPGDPTPLSSDPGLNPSTTLSKAPALSPQHFQSSRRERRVVINTPHTNQTFDLSLSKFNAPTQPTRSQQLAVSTLRRFKPHEVIAWLRLLHVLEPGYRLRDRASDISQLELDALSELQQCSPNLVDTWLAVASNSRPGQNAHDGRAYAQPPPTTSLPIIQRSSNQSTQRSSTQSGAFPSPHSQELKTSTIPSSLGHRTTIIDDTIDPPSKLAASPALSTTSYKRWCTICENSTKFTTSDGWKRHMREHETEYPCMPDGIAEMTEAGPRCWFCGSPWPDQDHLTIHLIAQCRESDGRPRNYTRMANLINHVEQFHRASDGRRLAEKWRNTNKNGKKYYACGFCISCYASLAEQTSHIDMQHWNCGQELKDWQPNNVILGLLLQPNVHDAWNGLVARHNVPRATHFSWHASKIGDLQQRLEQSRDSAENLAKWTFMQSSYYQRHGAEIETSAQSGLLDNAYREPPVALTPEMPKGGSGMMQTYEPSTAHARISPSLPSYPLANYMRYAHANMPNSNMSDYGSNLSDFQYGLSGGPDTPPSPHPGAGGRDISRNPTHPNIGLYNSSDQPWSNTNSAMHTDTNFNSHDESFGYDLGIPDAYASNTMYEDWSNWQNGLNQGGYRGIIQAHPAEHQAQAGETLDAAELDRFLSSHLDTSLPVSEEVPDRRFAPFSVAVQKRKYSGSTTNGPNTEGEVNVEMDVNTGQRSRYRPGDDHVRRRRRNDFSAL